MTWRSTLVVAAAVGAGVMAGAYFAFSSFVMPALRRLPPDRGLSAMQAINRQAPTPWFMTALVGTAVLCVAVMATTFGRLGERAAWWLLAGCALYLASVVLTGAYHVPRNDRLAELDPADPAAGEAWVRYAVGWVRWNHVRALTCVAATASFAIGLLRLD